MTLGRKATFSPDLRKEAAKLREQGFTEPGERRSILKIKRRVVENGGPGVDNQGFSDRIRARLRFLRWQVETGRQPRF